jgi:CHAD domain-containing protein
MFRAAGKLLGDYRDQQVLNDTVEALRNKTVENNTSSLAIPPAVIDQSLSILGNCLNAVADWPLDFTDFDPIQPGFSDTYRHAVRAWHATTEDPNDANFHSLRRKTKHHWYQVRLLERFNKKAIRPRRKRLRRLQLLLGDAHDLARVQDILESTWDRDQLVKRAVQRKQKYYAEAMVLADKLYAVEEKQLVDDFSRWWAATWRDSRTRNLK